MVDVLRSTKVSLCFCSSSPVFGCLSRASASAVSRCRPRQLLQLLVQDSLVTRAAGRLLNERPARHNDRGVVRSASRR